MKLKSNERIDDLQLDGLKLIQNKDSFCFGIDAVLLSYFASDMKKQDVIVDLCSGNGVVSILLAGKIKEAKKIYSVEIQKEVSNLAKRNVLLNHLEDKICVINDDLNNISKYISSGSVDSVVVNPPYKAKNTGIINETDTLTISRHEISCTLEDVIEKSAKILKSGGCFYMVHRPERLADIVFYMRKYKLEPKKIRFVHPNKNAMPNLMLIKGSRSGKPFLKFEKPLYVYDEKGNYTDEIYKIYNMKK